MRTRFFIGLASAAITFTVLTVTLGRSYMNRCGARYGPQGQAWHHPGHHGCANDNDHCVKNSGALTPEKQPAN